MSAKTLLSTRHRVVLAAILLASLTISILFALRVPLGGAPVVPGNPDEGDHRDYIRLLIRNHGFVRFVPTNDFAMASTEESPRPFETHQSPLYYLLCVPVQMASQGSVFAVRMVSALFQLLTILVVFRAVREACADRAPPADVEGTSPDRTGLALCAAAFVAFLPSQAQLAASISNDSLTTLICATIFWKLTRTLRKGQNTRDILMLGGLIGLGVLTKLSVFQLLPTIAVAYFLAFRLGRFPDPARAITAFAKTVGLGLLIASPWLVRNALLYGDPLTLHIYRLTGPNYTPDQIMPVFNWTMGDYVREVGVRSFATFWYLVDPNLPPNRFAGPQIPLLVVIILAIGGLLGVYRAAKEGLGTKSQRAIVGLAMAAILLMVPLFANFVLTIFQAQGRYFLPVLLPVAIVATVGWGVLLGPKRLTIGGACAAIVLLGLCMVQLNTLGVYW